MDVVQVAMDHMTVDPMVRYLRLYLSASDPAKRDVIAKSVVNAILANAPYWAWLNPMSRFIAQNDAACADVAVAASVAASVTADAADDAAEEEKSTK